MASEKAREIFENIMREKPRQVREDLNEAIATPVSELLEQEKRMIAESLFIGENNGDTTPNDESDPAGYRKNTGNEWGEGNWDTEVNQSNPTDSKMQTEETISEGVRVKPINSPSGWTGEHKTQTKWDPPRDKNLFRQYKDSGVNFVTVSDDNEKKKYLIGTNHDGPGKHKAVDEKDKEVDMDHIRKKYPEVEKHLNEENLGAEDKDADKPFSLSKLRKSKEKDRFNKDMSSDGYDKKKSDENLGA